jgi:hypothetical protein
MFKYYLQVLGSGFGINLGNAALVKFLYNKVSLMPLFQGKRQNPELRSNAVRPCLSPLCSTFYLCSFSTSERFAFCSSYQEDRRALSGNLNSRTFVPSFSLKFTVSLSSLSHSLAPNG